MNNSVPIWIVASLGKEVVLKRDFVGSCETYRAGWRGRLISIQAPIDGWQSLHVTVALDPNDISYEENFAFDEIRPVPGEIGSFDMQNGLINF